MKRNIAIIMGGYTSEANISIESGEVVFKNMDQNKYTPYKVHITKTDWFLIDENNKKHTVNKHDFSVELENNKIKFDCVFNAIHGEPGENGAILAYFDLLGIKHTSAPHYQMGLTYNKRDTLSVLKNYGIPTAKSVYLNKGDLINPENIKNEIGFPCFVKPNGAGSSFGISKVYTTEELTPAINKAYKEDDEILIESFLDGKEVSVGVIEYKNEIIVLPITEIVSENDFFDYEAKYEGKAQEITPARISDEEKEIVSKLAVKIYKTLKMKGFSRSEFIFKDGVPHFLEMNTVPGMTEASLLPQQAEHAGISLQELLTNAIETALNN